MDSDLYRDREQTAVKHRTLRRYLSAAAPILGSWISDICYVDCLAGPWQAIGESLQDTSFATAIDVLRESRALLEGRGRFPSMRCLLVEKDPKAFKRLKSYAGSISDVHVEAKNWDFADHVTDVVQFISSRRNTFPFIFIDPKGWELAAIDLIQPLLTIQPGEVLITLMTSWITRFLADPKKRFDRLVGSHLGRLKDLQGDEQEDELVRCYSEAVREAGQYAYVCTLPVMKPKQDAMHYYLVYGTRHPKGVEVFKSTEKTVVPFMHQTRAEAQQRRQVESSGQMFLLTADATYKEQRFTRLREHNLGLLRESIRRRLLSQKEVSYDELWAVGMQYGTVTEDDVRSVVEELVKAGDVESPELPPRQRVLQRGKGTRLRVRK